MAEPLGGLTQTDQRRIRRILDAFEAGQLNAPPTQSRKGVKYPTPFRLGKAAATISAGGSGDVDIWKGSTSTGPTGETITGFDWLGSGVANGAEVHVHRNFATGENFVTVASTGAAASFTPDSASWFSRWDSTGFRPASLSFQATSTSIFTISTGGREILTVGGGVFMWGMMCEFRTDISSTLNGDAGWSAFVDSDVDSTGFNARSDGLTVRFSEQFETTTFGSASINNHGSMGAVTHGNTIFGRGSTAGPGGYGVGAFAKGGTEAGRLEISAWVTKIAN